MNPLASRRVEDWVPIPAAAVRLAEAPRLIVVAYAIAPGPGGPESFVNTQFLRALAGHWPAGVTVISGGGAPDLGDRDQLEQLGWSLHPLGECGEAPRPSLPSARIAAWCARNATGLRSIPGRAINRLVHWRTGQGLKTVSWQVAARRFLQRELDQHPDAIVYSRALPLASVEAVTPVRRKRRFRWIVNINDPFPADLWPGLYQVNEWTARHMHSAVQRALPMIDAFTFPSAQLRALEFESFPDMARVPNRILPHIAERVTTQQVHARTERDAPLRIAFSGTLRKNRAREEFKEGLDEFVRRGPLAATRIEFSFHLRRPNAFGQRLIGGLPIQTRVTIGESDQEVERALLDADVLLDLESEPDRPLLLTKVTNCLALRKPIWAVCEPGGTTWNLVKKHGWGYASPLRAAAAMTGTLSEIHSDWTSGSLAAKAPSQDLVHRFSAKRQADDLAELCADLTNPAHRPATMGAVNWP